MKNYVIINGKSSKELSGLMINDLPPITRPLIRTQVEEIDGRDGDIITKLGYSAYDKTITIGLFGSFDINEVLAFFTNEGTIVFSNEEDKYYNFTQLAQIDVERLIKFKTATITFHCQPFKWSVVRFEEVFTSQFDIFNYGNIYSKPIYELTGTGTVNLSINNTQVLTIVFGDSIKTITIDTETLDAYDSNGLVNRSITGDYQNLFLNVGKSTFTWSGTLTQVKIKKASRWL